MRIAQQISHAFIVEIDKDVVRRVLAQHYRPAETGSSGPSWLTLIAQAALEHPSRVLKRPMNQLVNEALKDYVHRRSREVERDLEGTIAKLRAYRRRDPQFERAIESAADAEARLGKNDPAQARSSSANW